MLIALVAALSISQQSAHESLRSEAQQLRSLTKSAVAQEFLNAVDRLPAYEPRKLFRHKETREYYSQQSAGGVSDLEEVATSQQLYYYTKYGTPLAYVRALEILGQHGLASLKGKAVLDFGYGTVGHLRLMSLAGARPTGVDVDPFLPALYSLPSDRRGVNMVHGFWPGTPSVRTAVGGPFDLFASKNTLKRGYVHPEREVDKRLLVNLGVTDEEFVRQMFRSLKPGGWAIIYNLSPAPSKPDEPYKPWADGRCPFSRATLLKAGFQVLAHDANDDVAARAMGRALGWDQSGMNLESDLFGTYTLLRRPAL